ncbi:MAG: cytidylate kinase, partial [Flavisolibacter sp.]|nr:cytidylate kinase [Flavisolibacter sp.]
DDAIELDNTNLTEEEQFTRVMKLAEKLIG